MFFTLCFDLMIYQWSHIHISVQGVNTHEVVIVQQVRRMAIDTSKITDERLGAAL